MFGTPKYVLLCPLRDDPKVTWYNTMTLVRILEEQFHEECRKQIGDICFYRNGSRKSFSDVVISAVVWFIESTGQDEHARKECLDKIYTELKENVIIRGQPSENRSISDDTTHHEFDGNDDIPLQPLKRFDQFVEILNRCFNDDTLQKLVELIAFAPEARRCDVFDFFPPKIEDLIIRK